MKTLIELTVTVSIPDERWDAMGDNDLESVCDGALDKVETALLRAMDDLAARNIRLRWTS